MPQKLVRNPRLRLSLIIISLFILVLFLGPKMWSFAQSIAIRSVQEAATQRLQDAAAQWDRQGPASYQLTIAISGKWGECHVRTDIKQQADVTTIFDGCTTAFGAGSYRFMNSPKTVIEVFDYIVDRIETRECGPNGCRCDGIIAVHVSYDEELGYPEYITTSLERDWTSSPWLLSRESRLGCTLIGIILPEEVRIQVSPVQ